MATITRGELAKRCAVNFETVRYYERQGLIATPDRNASNYRVYDEETVRRILFIKRAKDVGFTLREIQDLLALRVRRGARCGDVVARADAKIADIDARIRSLTDMRRSLVALTEQCEGGDASISECPILDARSASP